MNKQQQPGPHDPAQSWLVVDGLDHGPSQNVPFLSRVRTRLLFYALAVNPL